MTGCKLDGHEKSNINIQEYMFSCIKKFRAEIVAEAVAQVKKELGYQINEEPKPNIKSPKVPSILAYENSALRSVVCIDLLPADQKSTFNQWMQLRECPLIRGFSSESWAYYSDYINWYNEWNPNA